MQLSHLLAESKAPRYTSYPTTPHFSASVTAAHYADWLCALPPHATLSLYLHVPYCRELCRYCGCHTKAVRRAEPVARYALSLAKEIASVARRAGSRHAARIHWGGGTPSILGPGNLRATYRALAAGFDLAGIEEKNEEVIRARSTVSSP